MSSWTGSSRTGATEDQGRSAEPRRKRIGIGKIAVLSLGVGIAAAVLLPFIPWPTVDADFATAMVLFGFAVGWALLAALSVRLSAQPQTWAYAPALFMGVGAMLLLVLPDAVLGALDWVRPPALLVLAAWVFRHAKRDLRSRTRTWMLNPVLALLVLFATGGAYGAIGSATEPRVAMRGELVDVGAYRLHLFQRHDRRPSSEQLSHDPSRQRPVGWDLRRGWRRRQHALPASWSRSSERPVESQRHHGARRPPVESGFELVLVGIDVVLGPGQADPARTGTRHDQVPRVRRITVCCGV